MAFNTSGRDGEAFRVNGYYLHSKKPGDNDFVVFCEPSYSHTASNEIKIQLHISSRQPDTLADRLSRLSTADKLEHVDSHHYPSVRTACRKHGKNCPLTVEIEALENSLSNYQSEEEHKITQEHLQAFHSLRQEKGTHQCKLFGKHCCLLLSEFDRGFYHTTTTTSRAARLARPQAKAADGKSNTKTLSLVGGGGKVAKKKASVPDLAAAAAAAAASASSSSKKARSLLLAASKSKRKKPTAAAAAGIKNGGGSNTTTTTTTTTAKATLTTSAIKRRKGERLEKRLARLQARRKMARPRQQREALSTPQRPPGAKDADVLLCTYFAEMREALPPGEMLPPRPPEDNSIEWTPSTPMSRYLHRYRRVPWLDFVTTQKWCFLARELLVFQRLELIPPTVAVLMRKEDA
jgi:hypothetical protein